jgi:hypothetical protein
MQVSQDGSRHKESAANSLRSLQDRSIIYRGKLLHQSFIKFCASASETLWIFKPVWLYSSYNFYANFSSAFSECLACLVTKAASNYQIQYCYSRLLPRGEYTFTKKNVTKINSGGSGSPCGRQVLKCILISFACTSETQDEKGILHQINTKQCNMCSTS